ncbi:hypothetical protein HDV05_002390 [Chytridiales sp. JEL 0842]|nr:hypothetical protein HDV05_002390 [Chytridiales sp. JEL 0842]
MTPIPASILSQLNAAVKLFESLTASSGDDGWKATGTVTTITRCAMGECQTSSSSTSASPISIRRSILSLRKRFTGGTQSPSPSLPFSKAFHFHSSSTSSSELGSNAASKIETRAQSDPAMPIDSDCVTEECGSNSIAASESDSKAFKIAVFKDISSRNPSSSSHLYKATARVPLFHTVKDVAIPVAASEALYQSEKVFAALLDPEAQNAWNAIFEDHQLIKRICPNTFLARMKLRKPASSKEFIVVVRTQETINGWIYVSTTAPVAPDLHWLYETSPGYARGKIDLLAWHVERIQVETDDNNHHLKVTSFLKMDYTLMEDWMTSLSSDLEDGLAKSLQTLLCPIYSDALLPSSLPSTNFCPYVHFSAAPIQFISETIERNNNSVELRFRVDWDKMNLGKQDMEASGGLAVQVRIDVNGWLDGSVLVDSNPYAVTFVPSLSRSSSSSSVCQSPASSCGRNKPLILKNEASTGYALKVDYFMVEEPYGNLSRSCRVVMPGELVQVKPCEASQKRVWTVSFFVREGMSFPCVVRVERVAAGRVVKSTEAIVNGVTRKVVGSEEQTAEGTSATNSCPQNPNPPSQTPSLARDGYSFVSAVLDSNELLSNHLQESKQQRHCPTSTTLLTLPFYNGHLHTEVISKSFFEFNNALLGSEHQILESDGNISIWWKPDKHTPIGSVKIVGTFHVKTLPDIQDLLACLTSFDRKSWSSNVKVFRWIDRLSPVSDVTYLTLNGSLVMMDRDYTLASTYLTTPTSFQVFETSVDANIDPSLPQETPDYVRGNCFVSGWHCEYIPAPEGEHKIRLFHIHRVDPRESFAPSLQSVMDLNIMRKLANYANLFGAPPRLCSVERGIFPCSLSYCDKKRQFRMVYNVKAPKPVEIAAEDDGVPIRQNSSNSSHSSTNPALGRSYTPSLCSITSNITSASGLESVGGTTSEMSTPPSQGAPIHTALQTTATSTVSRASMPHSKPTYGIDPAAPALEIRINLARWAARCPHHNIDVDNNVLHDVGGGTSLTELQPIYISICSYPDEQQVSVPFVCVLDAENHGMHAAVLRIWHPRQQDTTLTQRLAQVPEQYVVTIQAGLEPTTTDNSNAIPIANKDILLRPQSCFVIVNNTEISGLVPRRIVGFGIQQPHQSCIESGRCCFDYGGIGAGRKGLVWFSRQTSEGAKSDLQGNVVWEEEDTPRPVDILRKESLAYSTVSSVILPSIKLEKDRHWLSKIATDPEAHVQHRAPIGKQSTEVTSERMFADPLNHHTRCESLDDLRREIQLLTSIPTNAQIMLTSSGAQVKADLIAAAIANEQSDRLPPDELVIFVFNRLVLDPRVPHETFTQVAVEIEPPVPIEVLQDTIPYNDRFQVPLEEQCQAYLNAFQSHVSYAVAIWKTANNHLEACQKLLEEQRTQAEALRVALTNLSGHSKTVCDAFEVFNSHAQKDITKHQGLLQNFPSDLQALHRIPIHSNIDEGQRFLSDYVPEDKLLTWAESCRAAHDQLVRKVAEVADIIKTIKTGTNTEMHQPVDIDFQKLEGFIMDVTEMVQQIDGKRQLLERDFSRVELTVRDIPRNPAQAPDKMNAIDHLHEIHRNEYLVDITENDHRIRETVTHFVSSKIHLTHLIISRLQTISHLQSSIASVSPLLTKLTSTLTSQSQAFGQLLHVHRMSPAWGAALVECVRRKEYVKVFLQKASMLAEVLAKFRIQEEKRRENFKNEILRYLPTGLIKGLEDRPPYCEISVSNTSDSLPNLTREDLAEFEKRVMQIRTNMMESDSQVKPAASMTGGNPSDSISKLQATMLKMASQVDGIATEFDRILLRSGVSDKAARLEEENARLRAELASVMGSRHAGLVAGVSISPNVNSGIPGSPGTIRRQLTARASVGGLSENNSQSDLAKAEETIKAYEHRIRNLEALLQKNYHNQMSSSRSQMMGNNTFDSNSENQTTAFGSNASSPHQNHQLPHAPSPDRNAASNQQLNELRSSVQSLEERLAASENALQKATQQNADLTRQLRESENRFRNSQEVFQKEIQSTQIQLRESERQAQAWKQRSGEYERECDELRNLVDIKEREKGVWVAEVERAAGLLRELFGLLDACGDALIVKPKNTMPLSAPTTPLTGVHHPGNPTVNTSSIAMTIAGNPHGTYMMTSPTSPPAPPGGPQPMVYVPPHSSTTPTSAPPYLRSSSSTSATSSTPPSSYFAHTGSTPPTSIITPSSAPHHHHHHHLLSNLRSDTKEIRRRLRELEDDIRCQTLQLVGLREEIGLNADGEVPTTVGGSSALEGDEEDDGGSGAGTSLGFSGLRSGSLGEGEEVGLGGVVEGEEGGDDVSGAEGVEGGAVERGDSLLEDWRGKVEELSGLVDELQAKLDSKSDALLKAESTVEELTRERVNLEERLKELEAMVESINAEWKSKESQWISKHQSQLDDLQASHNRQLESFEQEWKQKLDALESTLAANAKAQLEDLQSQHNHEKLQWESTIQQTRTEMKNKSKQKAKARMQKWKEEIEDWRIVCGLAVEQLKDRHNALVSLSETWKSILDQQNGLVEAGIRPATSLFMAKEADGSVFEPLQPLHATSNSQDPSSDSALLSPSTTSSLFEDDTTYTSHHHSLLTASSSSSSSSEAEDDDEQHQQAPTTTTTTSMKPTLHQTYHATLLPPSPPLNTWLQSFKASLLSQHPSPLSKITFQSFSPPCLALFLPTRHPQAWAAFNVNSPHYFLSLKSLKSTFDKERRGRDWVLGVIEGLERRVVPLSSSSSSLSLTGSEGSGLGNDKKGEKKEEGGEEEGLEDEEGGLNPFGLKAGSVWYVCKTRRWEGMSG